MTYKELLAKLNTLTEAQLGKNVTMYECNNDEVHDVHGCDVAGAEADGEVGAALLLSNGDFYLVC